MPQNAKVSCISAIYSPCGPNYGLSVPNSGLTALIFAPSIRSGARAHTPSNNITHHAHHSRGRRPLSYRGLPPPLSATPQFTPALAFGPAKADASRKGCEATRAAMGPSGPMLACGHQAAVAAQQQTCSLYFLLKIRPAAGFKPAAGLFV